MNIGKMILELRRKKNVTQDALAAELGVTAAAVSKWENGYTLPDILMLCALADYFEVTTDELLGRNPKPFCAAVATTDLAFGERIAELIKQYGFWVKHIYYGEAADAIPAIKSDKEVTHLFISFDKPMMEYETDDSDIHIIESHSDTEQKILDGFEIFLKNMPHFEALAPKSKETT